MISALWLIGYLFHLGFCYDTGPKKGIEIFFMLSAGIVVWPFVVGYELRRLMK